MIGIIDQRWLCDTVNRVPNLEAMKIASYWRAKRENVELILSLSSLQKYEKIYYRYDIYDRRSMSGKLGVDVEAGGLVLSNGTYRALNPIEMETSKPDISLYKEALKKKAIQKQLTPTQQRELLFGSYNRCMLNGEIQVTAKSFKGMGSTNYIYDNDICNYEGLSEILNMIDEETKLWFYYMNRIYTPDALERLYKYRDRLYPHHGRYLIMYSLDLGDFATLLKFYGPLFWIMKKLYFNIPYKGRTEQEILSDLEIVLSRVIWSRSEDYYCNIFCEDGMSFVYPELYTLIRDISYWLDYGKAEPFNMYNENEFSIGKEINKYPYLYKILTTNLVLLSKREMKLS